MCVCVCRGGEDEGGGAALCDSVRDDFMLKPAGTDAGRSEEQTNGTSSSLQPLCQ